MRTLTLCIGIDISQPNERTNVLTIICFYVKTHFFFILFSQKCQRRELPTVETRRVEVTSSQSDVLTVPSLFQRTRLSREWPSETSSNPLPSEIYLKPLSTLNTPYQRLTTSYTTVSLVLFTPESSELDPEPTEETEPHLKDQDSTEIIRFLQLTLPRKLYKFLND